MFKMMLWIFFALALNSATAAPNIPVSRSLVPTSIHDSKSALSALPRQLSPVNAALTGVLSPPFIVMVGLGALAHTMEKFVTDMVRYTSGRETIRRRKKKKPQQQQIKPFPPLQIARPPPPPPPPQEPAPVSAPAEAEAEQGSEAPSRYQWRF